ADRDGVLVESHLAHHLDADKVVVLRCRPDELERRLTDRGESEAKARENAESEALDVILSEAVDAHGVDRVYEVETTDRSPEAVAEEIAAVLAGEREPSAGTVDYLDYL
ncbi:adenylate kinase family protein, partial [Halorussus sp. GCM10023401]